MSNDALDLAFARHVRTIGLVSAEQVNAALQAQAKAHQDGKPISVADAMVQLGLVTPAQKESLEKKVKEQQAGVQQLGPYRLMKKLGEGGMGAVYLALDSATQKHVAVKVLPRNLGANPEFVKRFRRESDAAIALQHPNIIGAFAAGEDLGYHYYAMEYCEGKPLDVILAADKRLPVDKAVDVVTQAAQGLKYAHDQGIIHRDIKPSNIIVTPDGLTKVLDLGLSKNLEDAGVSFKTVTGAVLGTPHYISPEQAQGEKNVDGRSDIYSLGATLYHLLTGQVPFDGATPLEILSKHVNTVLPNPQDLREDIPDAAVHVLQRMMAKKPDDRYRDCGALIADLLEVSAGRAPKTNLISASLSAIAPSKKSMARKRSPTIRRAAEPRANRAPLYAGIAVAAAVVVVLAVAFSGSHGPPPEAPQVVRPAAPPKDPEPAKAGFDGATWEKSLAALSPEARLKAVINRLKDLNSGYDGSERHETSHGRVSRLELSHVALRDLSPLRALADLTQLDLGGTSVADLSPLAGLKLVSLSCGGLKSADLRSIRAMRELKILSLKSSPLRDLSPLAGMELWQLDLRGTGLRDLSPLRQMKVRELLADVDPKRDGTVLRPLSDLEKINDLPVAEFWRREKGPEPIAASGPEAQFQSVLSRLKELNPAYNGQETHRMENGVVTELAIEAVGLGNVAAISDLKGLRRAWLNGRWDREEQKEYRSPLRDLRPLKGLPLIQLWVHQSDVEDLSPLQGMKLDLINFTSTLVSDLSPLRGMPLKKVEAGWSRVRDLAPLESSPIEYLDLRGLDVTDFAPLRGMPLRTLQGPLNAKQHASLLASIKTLETVNGVPVAEFLKSAEPPPPPPAVKPPEPAVWKNGIDLIPLIDLSRDVIRGNWKKDNGHIVADFGSNSVLRIPYEPPAEYDFRIVFVRERGKCAVAQFLQREGRGFFWEMGGWENSNAGFSQINEKGSKDNPTNCPFVPRDGVRYTSLIQVRRDRVTALLDDRKISEWLPSMGEISTDPNWCVDAPNLIGLGNCDNLTRFEVVQVREISGKGRLRTTMTTPADPAFIQTVARLPAAEQVKRVTEKLKDLNPLFDPGQARTRMENDRVLEFACPTQKLLDVWPLRAFPYLRKLDLSDATPGMLADISCLKGARIQELNLRNTRVVDLSPLKDMPLQHLEFERGIVTDLTPLKSLRTLKTVNEQPAADFWKSQNQSWTALFDGRTLDFMRNPLGWKVDKGSIINDPAERNAAQTKFEFENGDVRIRFEPRGIDSLMFRVRQNDGGACGVSFDGAGLKQMEGKTYELVLFCRGTQVSATLNGKPIALAENKSSRSGCIQFNGNNGSLRVFSVEYRAP
jgi:serine/threonine-protein kinase